MANFEETFSHRIHPIILEYYKEIFFNWISEEEEAAVKDIATKKVQRFAEYKHELTEKGYLQNIPLEIISSKLITAFCWIILEEYEDSMISITDAREKLTEVMKNYRLISHGHYLGLLHLIQGLATVRQYLLASSEFPKESEEHLIEIIEKSDSKRYDDLPEKAHVAIKGVHAFFLYSFLMKRNEELVPVFKELTKSDPGMIEWFLQSYHATRLSRRESDRYTPPSEAEKQLIEECLKLNRDHVLVKFAVCHYLCEIYTARQISAAEVIQLSDNIKLRKNEIVDFVKDTAKEIFDDQTMAYSVRINQGMAEFFMKSFPVDARDPVMAKECLLRALEVSPSRSKTNHKMGILLMVYEKNYDEALKFISKAYDSKTTNFGALIDIIQLKMRNPDENYEELIELFESSKDNEKFERSRRANLLVLLGILHFLRGNPDGCIGAWVEAFQLEEENTKATLKGHYSRTQRYGWEQPKVADLRKMLIEKKREYLPDHHAIPYINQALEAMSFPGHRGQGPNPRSYDNSRNLSTLGNSWVLMGGQHLEKNTWRGRAMGASTSSNFRSGTSDQQISDSDSDNCFKEQSK